MKFKMRLSTIFVCAAVIVGVSGIQSARADLDAPSQEAMEKTSALLKNKDQRDAAVQASPEAKEKNADVEKLAGSKENTDAMYGVSADIFEKMVKDSKGDGTAMQKNLEEAQRNPSAFLNSLTPEQRKSIESIAQKIEQGQSSEPVLQH